MNVFWERTTPYLYSSDPEDFKKVPCDLKGWVIAEISLFEIMVNLDRVGQPLVGRTRDGLRAAYQTKKEGRSRGNSDLPTLRTPKREGMEAIWHHHRIPRVKNPLWGESDDPSKPRKKRLFLPRAHTHTHTHTQSILFKAVGRLSAGSQTIVRRPSNGRADGRRTATRRPLVAYYRVTLTIWT